jgi:hypothetical protein
LSESCLFFSHHAARSLADISHLDAYLPNQRRHSGEHRSRQSLSTPYAVAQNEALVPREIQKVQIQYIGIRP